MDKHPSGNQKTPVRRILYLARFAPLSDNEFPCMDAEWGNSPFYHHRLYEALKDSGIEIVSTREPEDILKRRDQIDFVYSIYNRAKFRNSEIFVSSLCEYADLAYLGGHPNIRAIAEDKHLTKLIAEHLRIPTPIWIKVDPWEDLKGISSFPLPCIVKWRYGADSSMVTANCIAFDEHNAIARIRDFQQRGIPVIVEQLIPGTNLSTGVLGGTWCRVLRTVRIDTDEIYNIQTYDQKKFGKGLRKKSYFENDSITGTIKKIIERIYDQIQPLDYFRVDFRYHDPDGALYLLEINAVCNLHPDSTFVMSCGNLFSEYNKIVRAILDISLNRQALFIE